MVLDTSAIAAIPVEAHNTARPGELSGAESDERALLAELRWLVETGVVRLELDRRKIEHIDFPLAVQADGNRWIYAAAALSALAFWRLGLVAGVTAALAGFVLYRTLGLRFVARRLDARIRERGLYSVDHWRKLWRFGGVVLTGPDGTPCQGPAQSWMAMVRASRDETGGPDNDPVIHSQTRRSGRAPA